MLRRKRSHHPPALVLLVAFAGAVACAFPTFGGGQPAPPGPTVTLTASATAAPTETPLPTASPTILPTVAATAFVRFATPTEIVVPSDFPGLPALPVEPPAPPTKTVLLVTNNTSVIIVVSIAGQELWVDPGETLPLLVQPGFYEYNIVAQGYQIFASGATFPAGYWTWIVDPP